MVTATSAGVTFSVPSAMVMLEKYSVTSSLSAFSMTKEVTAFVPADAKGPVPAFLLICNRDYKANCDPEREKKSPFFPVEEIVKRGFAAVSFYTWDVAPDYNTGNTKGVRRRSPS